MRSNRRALIIGVQNYAILPLLKYARNDAELINAQLQEYNCQFSCLLLTNEQATAKSIRDSFRELFKDAADDAIIIFYFAGHGIVQDKATFLVTLDVEDDPESGVSFDRLTQYVKSYIKESQSVIFILDCCHAGAMPVEEISIILNPVIDTVSRTSGITLLAATEETEKAYERDDIAQGVFTNFLFLGLSGAAANPDGKVTTSSLHDYMSKAMEVITHKQRLVYKTTIIGESPILAQGYSPQTYIHVSKLQPSKITEIESIFRSRINEVRRNSEGDRSAWFDRYYSEASNSISLLMEFMSKQEKIYPEITAINEWKNYEQDLISIKTLLADIRTGIKIPSGTVIEEIGRGGFGTVYKVVMAGGSTQAYKVYHGAQLNEKMKVRAFVRGYNAMKELNHPNIVQVYSNTQAPLGFFMQYIDGQNLRDWWNDDIPKLMSLLHIIAQTLEYAHSKGVIHRDIKPENIIINVSNPDKPIPFLTDFDLAWYSMATVYSAISEYSAFGHYLYAAPEQFLHPGMPITQKPTTDVYGFGQLCYFAICGQDPTLDNQISISSLKDRLKSWGSLEPARDFLQLYSKCTEKRPDDRHQNMAEISNILLGIRNNILDPNTENIINRDVFISEVIFALFGFEVPPSQHFNSRSNRTSIDLYLNNHEKIELYFRIIQAFTGYTGNFEQQRDNITRKIDSAINELKVRLGKDITRSVDKHAKPYGVTICLSGIMLTLDGARYTAQVIREIINHIEFGG